MTLVHSPQSGFLHTGVLITSLFLPTCTGPVSGGAQLPARPSKGNVAAKCTPPFDSMSQVDVSVPDSYLPHPGEAYNHLSGAFLQHRCLTGLTDPAPASSAPGAVNRNLVFDVTVRTSDQFSFDDLDLHASAAFSTIGAGGSIRASFARQASLSAHSVYVFVKTSWVDQTDTQLLDQVQFTPDALTALNQGDAQTFVRKCGTGFVASRKYGGEFVGVLEIHDVADSQYRQVSADFSANGLGAQVTGALHSAAQKWGKSHALTAHVLRRAQITSGAPALDKDLTVDGLIAQAKAMANAGSVMIGASVHTYASLGLDAAADSVTALSNRLSDLKTLSAVWLQARKARVRFATIAQYVTPTCLASANGALAKAQSREDQISSTAIACLTGATPCDAKTCDLPSTISALPEANTLLVPTCMRSCSFDLSKLYGPLGPLHTEALVCKNLMPDAAYEAKLTSLTGHHDYKRGCANGPNRGYKDVWFVVTLGGRASEFYKTGCEDGCGSSHWSGEELPAPVSLVVGDDGTVSTTLTVENKIAEQKCTAVVGGAVEIRATAVPTP